MVATNPVPWPFFWQGIHSELAAAHIPPTALSSCVNMYYLTPHTLRSRGGFDETYDTTSANPVKVMYWWDYDSKLYIANDNSQLYKNTTAVTGPAEDVVDMVSFGVGATPKLIVAESKAAQGHTLHTYTGAAYAVLTGSSVPTAERLMVRFGRLFATKDSVYPSRVFFSDVGDETVWVGAFGEGGWFDIAPGEDGDIVDWVDFQGALYVFKERGIYRVTGDLPGNFRSQKLTASDKVIGGTVCDCGDGVLYATNYGIFPVFITAQREREDLTRNIEQEIQAVLANAKAAYSPEMGAYIVCSQGTTLYVSNHNNRPDAWTKFVVTPTAHSVYQGNGLYLGGAGGKVYKYVHAEYEDDSVAFATSFKTGFWDLGDKLHLKNVRHIEGALNAKENSTATVKTYIDGSGSAQTTDALATTARNLIRCGFNYENMALEIVYTSMTGPVVFGGALLRLRLLEGAVK